MSLRECLERFPGGVRLPLNAVALFHSLGLNTKEKTNEALD